MADYTKMTDQDYDDILEDIVKENVSTLLSVPGAHEVFSEYFNNEVLNQWAEDNHEKAYPEDYDED
jgi:hypothetical protein